MIGWRGAHVTGRALSAVSLSQSLAVLAGVRPRRVVCMCVCVATRVCVYHSSSPVVGFTNHNNKVSCVLNIHFS